jgi:hypothetical protein
MGHRTSEAVIVSLRSCCSLRHLSSGGAGKTGADRSSVELMAKSLQAVHTDLRPATIRAAMQTASIRLDALATLF